MEKEYTVWSYIDFRMEVLRGEGRRVTAGNYGRAKRCLWRYCQDVKLKLEKLEREDGRLEKLKLGELEWEEGRLEKFKLGNFKPEELRLEDITEEFVNGLNEYLTQTGIQKQTISFYNRVLRSIYNQAAKEGIVKNTHPFDGVYTKVIAKLNPVSISEVKTETGEIVKLESLSKDELMKRYRTLQQRYNRLVGRITELVGA